MWRARPVFVSSTFRDMHAERDWLRGNAVPRLAERLRERCHYLDTVDLRPGIEGAGEVDEAAHEMQVLEVCLDEIERCKPFFAGLLGDRRGRVPPAERTKAAARDAGLPESVDVEGRSVTELEILYAVLEKPDQRHRSWFFLRTRDRAGMPPEVAARFPAEESFGDPRSPAGRLRALKDRIRREMSERVREYTLRHNPAAGGGSGGAVAGLVELQQLDGWVEEALGIDLDAETVAYLREAPRTWQEADARWRTSWRSGESMTHLLGHGDRERAAEYLGWAEPLQWSDASAAALLAGAVAVLVKVIQSAPDDAARQNLREWIAPLINGADLEQTGRVARVMIFDLNDALGATGAAQTEVRRGRFLKAARRALGRLAASDSTNAGWQRNLVVSYWRMAASSEKTDGSDAREWWRRAYRALSEMKPRGILLPTDEQYLAILKKKAGGDRENPSARGFVPGGGGDVSVLVSGKRKGYPDGR